MPVSTWQTANDNTSIVANKDMVSNCPFLDRIKFQDNSKPGIPIKMTKIFSNLNSILLFARKAKQHDTWPLCHV
jgi:hypothetical protein